MERGIEYNDVDVSKFCNCAVDDKNLPLKIADFGTDQQLDWCYANKIMRPVKIITSEFDKRLLTCRGCPKNQRGFTILLTEPCPFNPHIRDY